MKRAVSLLLTGLIAVSLAACGNTNGSESGASEKNLQVSEREITATENEENISEETEQAEEDAGITEETDAAGETNTLVVYFSYGENADLPEGVDASSSASIQMWNGETTGNTGFVAHTISEATGADLFSIQTVEKYPDSYDATIDQGQEERSAGARPQLATHIENLDSYDTIILGFPNWWGVMPMAMYTFLEEYDLSGKTIIPFVTSGGSGFSSTIHTIESIQSGAEVQEGISISDSSATNAQSQIEEWLTHLGY